MHRLRSTNREGVARAWYVSAPTASNYVDVFVEPVASPAKEALRQAMMHSLIDQAVGLTQAKYQRRAEAIALHEHDDRVRLDAFAEVRNAVRAAAADLHVDFDPLWEAVRQRVGDGVRQSGLDAALDSADHMGAIHGLLTTRKIHQRRDDRAEDDPFELDVPVNLTLLHTHSDDEHDAMLATLVGLAARTLVGHTDQVLAPDQATTDTDLANKAVALAHVTRALVSFRAADFVAAVDYTKALFRHNSDAAAQDAAIDETHKVHIDTVLANKPATDLPEYVYAATFPTAATKATKTVHYGDVNIVDFSTSTDNDVRFIACDPHTTTSNKGGTRSRQLSAFADVVGAGVHGDGIEENITARKAVKLDAASGPTTPLYVPCASDFLREIDLAWETGQDHEAHDHLAAVLRVVDPSTKGPSAEQTPRVAAFVAAVNTRSGEPDCGPPSSSHPLAQAQFDAACSVLVAEGLLVLPWVRAAVAIRLAQSRAACSATLHEALSHTRRPTPTPTPGARRHYRLVPLPKELPHDGVLDFDHGGGWTAGETSSPSVDALYAVLSFVSSLVARA